MSNLMPEIWKPVKISGYEDLYEVSNYGNVRSTTRYKKILKRQTVGNGYLCVQLWSKGKCKGVFVHRLVALSFVENPLNKPFVNHKDEIKSNCNADNLEWVTHIENCNYGTAIKRRTEHFDYSKRKINNANQIKACSKPIIQVGKDNSIISEWNSISECARTNNWTISNIARSVKTGNKAYGYNFYERSDYLCRVL